MYALPPGLEREKRRPSPPQDWLRSGGVIGELIQSMNWSESPLGLVESWPQSLRTTVSLCLASNFPISLAWGPQHTQIYNAGYAVVCGAKHPQSLGQDFRECWASAWPVIGEAFERALAGEASFLENQRIILDRNGYLEETFFTFSFSPIRDDHGIVGLFHPVTETTTQMISERHTRALRDLAACTGKAQTLHEACSLAMETLAEYKRDLPFVQVYLLEGTEARLAGAIGLPPESWANRARIDFSPSPASDLRTGHSRIGPPTTTRGGVWPLETVYTTGLPLHLENVEIRFGHLICGEYPEPVQQVMLLPITPAGCKHPLGVIVAGISQRLPLNEGYRAFYDLVAATLTSAFTNARAYEEELKRAEALAEINRAKTDFFSNVSHEFRTPLTLMLGTLEEELAEETESLPTARRDRLLTAHRNSLRLLKLVNNLLDFSRIEAGRMQASYQPTDLAEYTQELASVFRSAIQKAGLMLVVECPSLPEPVFVDREMWEKIVLNLLSNALKHTFAGSIAVRLKGFVHHVELSVTDTGVGIRAAELPHLFERFHRVKGTQARTYEGTGIGLALVRELALLHGGDVRVESEEGRGSTFSVKVKTGTAHLPADQLRQALPLTVTASTAAAYVAETLSSLPTDLAVDCLPVRAEAVPAPASSSENKRLPQILLADDNADMRDYVTRLLSRTCEVIPVSDGVAALSAARESIPDLVLSDIMMPHLDGLGLLHALREDPATRMVPVIFLSARAGQEHAVEGLKAGADDYLAKPFSGDELLARVHTHLEQAQVRRAWMTELEQSNKELETFSYSVSHDLRAPLRAIDGFSKLLLEEYADRLDDQGCRYLQRVRSGTQAMSAIINDLLSLSRLSRGVLRRQETDLSAMVRHILTGLVQRHPSLQVKIEIEDGVTARVDRRLMKIALLNLLDNAWKYTQGRTPPTIAFGHQKLGRELVFFVRDNGLGFDQAHADRLFTPFQRLHNAPELSGAGIGLATVHRVIVRHGGRIWAESAVGSGATFYFTFGENG